MYRYGFSYTMDADYEWAPNYASGVSFYRTKAERDRYADAQAAEPHTASVTIVNR